MVGATVRGVEGSDIGSSAGRTTRESDQDDVRPERGGPDVTAEIRDFWDEDAADYDNSPSHYPRRPQEQAAWAAALRRLLPDPPTSVLDVGAGTGFLSLLLAGQGYQVTALDLSPSMLGRLRAKAAEAGLPIETIEADAADPPRGPFAAVVERHLLWTLPDPGRAVAAWHAVAPGGRLVAIEGSWGGQSTSGLEGLRSRVRILADRIRRPEPGHHGHYSQRIRDALPFGAGLTPAQAVALIQASPWTAARIERLRDVEWAVTEGRGLLDDLLGTHPRWAVVAGS